MSTQETLARQFTTTQRKSEYKGRTYLAEYRWKLGLEANEVHKATIQIWDNEQKKGEPLSEEIEFAGKKLSNLRELFNKSGFAITNEYRHERGLQAEPFVTFQCVQAEGHQIVNCLG